MPTLPNLESLIPYLEIAIALLGAYFVAFWVGLILWTFQDVRRRSRDILVQFMALLLVLVFNLPGLLLYYLLRPAETLDDAYERSLEEEAILQGLEERNACPGCKQTIQPDYLLCPNCSTKLKRQCASCGRLLNLKWTICPYCGK
jgi:RNA polymerase subunit RPABC4/transcription elongation factor Spt4